MNRTETETKALEILHDVWTNRAQMELDSVLFQIGRADVKTPPDWDRIYRSIEIASVCTQFKDDLWHALCGDAFGAIPATQQFDLMGLVADWRVLWKTDDEPARKDADMTSYRQQAARQCLDEMRDALLPPPAKPTVQRVKISPPPPHKISAKQALANAGMSMDISDLRELVDDAACPACCSEDCIVEPDGTCPHGFPSVLVEMGLI